MTRTTMMSPSDHCLLLIHKGIKKARTLSNMTGVSIATAHRHLRVAKNGKPPPKKKGRKFCLTSAEKTRLKRYALKYSGYSNAQLAKKLEESGGRKVSVRTIGRYLTDMSVKRVKPRPVPLLTERHRQKRLAWCLQNQDTDWEKIVFSDESCFQYVSNTSRVLCRVGERPLAPRTSHPPKIMVWGGISARGVTPLAVIQGSVDSDKYQEILNGYLFPTMDVLYPEGYTLQQDNARPHVSLSSKKFFEDHGLKVMDWPANSPDLNPIENLWGILKRKMAPLKKPPVAEWKVMINEMWSSLSHDTVSGFIESMPRRIQSCIEAGGGHTKY